MSLWSIFFMGSKVLINYFDIGSDIIVMVLNH